MIIDEFNLNIDEVVGTEKNFLKKYNNIYISEEQISILNKYNINIDKYTNVNELMYDIEDCLNDSYEELEDLEWVSQTLSEYNYYNNTNKYYCNMLENKIIDEALKDTIVIKILTPFKQNNSLKLLKVKKINNNDNNILVFYYKKY